MKRHSNGGNDDKTGCGVSIADLFDPGWKPPAASPETLNEEQLIPDILFEEFLDQGHLGKVYSARQIELDRRVAVKLVPVDLSSPEYRERLNDEAKTLAKLHHPRIVTIFDAGIADPDGDAWFYMVLELVDGSTLAAELSKEDRMSQWRALDLMRQTTEAIIHAHEQGVVHLDLKPANILITKEGDAKIADFGLAKILRSGGMDDFGQWGGTPEFADPLQFSPDYRPTPASDIHALGRVLAKLAESADFTPGVADAVKRVIRRATEQDPSARFASANDLGKEIQWLLDAPIRKRRRTVAGITIGATLACIFGVYVWSRPVSTERTRAKKKMSNPVFAPGAHTHAPLPVITRVHPSVIPLNSYGFDLEIHGRNFQPDVRYYVWASHLVLKSATKKDNALATFVNPGKLKIRVETVSVGEPKNSCGVAIRWGAADEAKTKNKFGLFRLVEPKKRGK